MTCRFSVTEPPLTDLAEAMLAERFACGEIDSEEYAASRALLHSPFTSA